MASMLDLGVKRVIIGTKAAKNPEFIGEVVEEFGTDCIVAGIDAKDGKVAIEGWEKLSCLSALDLCKKMKDFGVQHIVSPKRTALSSPLHRATPPMIFSEISQSRTGIMSCRGSRYPM